MNAKISTNYSKLRVFLFLLPLFLLITIVLFLYQQHALSINSYTKIQQDSFFFINHHLGSYPNLQFNLTQFGDCLISLSLLSLFIVYAPKIWEAFLSASLISCLLTRLLKSLFAVPRPAATFDHSKFIITGEILSGNNSLPSGHAITIFTAHTVLMFAFMPKKISPKIIWFFLAILIGLILVFTRVGVGAHYPIDVIVGSIIGYISGLLGIFISRKYKIWSWINDKKYYPIFIVLFLICTVVLINRMIHENLFIYYLSLSCLLFSTYKIITVYVQK
ncbi:MAG TPA: phosphatase PAP2 family protein [Flavobacterium sp.]|nr:phosphatase PAP2 family protein [Flavobacterium sp.]